MVVCGRRGDDPVGEADELLGVVEGERYVGDAAHPFVHGERFVDVLADPDRMIGVEVAAYEVGVGHGHDPDGAVDLDSDRRPVVGAGPPGSDARNDLVLIGKQAHPIPRIVGEMVQHIGRQR